MVVITAMSGSAIFDSAAISPRALMPSSKTAASQQGCISSTDSGSPIWLLRLPSVLCALYFSESME